MLIVNSSRNGYRNLLRTSLKKSKETGRQKHGVCADLIVTEEIVTLAARIFYEEKNKEDNVKETCNESMAYINIVIECDGEG